MLKFLTFFCALFITLSIHAQSRLANASFEGEPQDATTPANWHPCELGTTPDILPGPWGVHKEASEGETFMGLITREDGTFESVGQRLATPLQAKECFSFTVDLAYSVNYASYNNPIKLKVYGASTRCSKDQLLVETEIIDHTEWETYEFKFFTKVPVNYIILEASDGFGKSDKKQKGNINIDAMSDIKFCGRAMK